VRRPVRIDAIVGHAGQNRPAVIAKEGKAYEKNFRQRLELTVKWNFEFCALIMLCGD
jgi:hypothetical protein